MMHCNSYLMFTAGLGSWKGVHKTSSSDKYFVHSEPLQANWT